MLDDPVAARDFYRKNAAEFIDAHVRPVLEHQLRTAAAGGGEARGRQIVRGAAASESAGLAQIAGRAARQRGDRAGVGGNQAAVSPKGAIGVMQVMPDTAREVAGQMGLEYDPRS
jgi:hypothetical protein